MDEQLEIPDLAVGEWEHQVRVPVPPPRLRAGRAAVVLASYIGLQLVGGLVVGIGRGVVAALRGEDLHGPDAVAQLTQSVMAPAMVLGLLAGGVGMVLVAVLLVGRELRDRAPEDAAWVAGAPTQLLGGGLVGLLIGAGTVLVMALLQPDETIQGGPLTQMAASPGTAQLAWLLMALVLAPPLEELLFRGLVFGGLCRSFGRRTAWVVTTVVFVLLHITETIHFPPAMLGLAAMALCAQWLRLRSGAVGPAVAVHLAYNAVVAVVVVIGTHLG